MKCGHLHSCRHIFSLLLLLACLLGVGALGCQHVIHKKVGDSVELSACSPAEGVTIAKWAYNGSRIADITTSVDEKQFTGRLKFDPTNFSLTVKNLRQQDSGEFWFVSGGSGVQRPTVTITLNIHEPITEEPTLSGNSSGLTSTNSCMVLLECSSNSGSEVSFNWTVGNETFQGPRLPHSIRAQDGDTKFTCTVFNPVSEKSKSYTVKCSSEPTEEKSPVNITIVISVAGAILAVLIIVGIAVCWHCKQRQTDSSHEDPTVYADITEVGYHSDPMKPNSEYETIGSLNFPVQSGPQTVYDKIQLNRLRKVSISPYQDIS